MEQCRAGVAGPRELDLAGHCGRREEEEGGEAAQRRGSGGLYRPESTWTRGVASREGGFGPGWLDGERAEGSAALCLAGVAWRLGSVSGTRARVGKCQGAGQVALEGFPGSICPRAHGGQSPPAAYGGRREQSRPGEREMEIRAYL